MERLKNYKEIQKCNIIYTTEKDGKRFIIGTLAKVFLLDRLIYAYIYELDEQIYEYLMKKYPKEFRSDTLRGVDVEERGYYIASSRVPVFVELRTPHPKMGFVGFYMAKYGMTVYDRFDYLLRSGGIWFDNITVEEIEVDSNKIIE